MVKREDAVEAVSRRVYQVLVVFMSSTMVILEMGETNGVFIAGDIEEIAVNVVAGVEASPT